MVKKIVVLDTPWLYKNGSPYDKRDLIDKNLYEAVLALKSKQPVVIVIDGGQSTGKSTLGIHLLDSLNKIYGKQEVDLDEKDNKQYAFGGEQFIKKLPLCQEAELPAIEYDESGDYSRKGALSRFNKTMDRAMDMVRIYQVAIVIVVHNFAKQVPSELIDKQIATVLIHCLKREPGVGHVEAKVYDYSGMCWIRHNMKTEVIPENAYKKVYPNFHFRFKDLRPERSVLLDKLSGMKKKELYNMTEIKIQGLLSYKEIAYKVQMSEAWVKKQMSQLRIKHVTMNKKRKFFSPDVADIITRK